MSKVKNVNIFEDEGLSVSLLFKMVESQAAACYKKMTERGNYGGVS